MTTLHTTIRSGSGGSVAYSKGAADEVLASCTSQLRSDGDGPLEESDREAIRAIERRMAGEGLRVLAIARKTGASLEDAERQMTLLGLVAMMDPPRAEARAAVQTCEAAGIRAVMITGDHPLTASTIASELGILKGGRAVTGRDLEAMSDADLQRDVADIAVYARVSPADKLRVVTAWQSRGQVVAMTGDGVNDAPALKKADVGIAMGIAGTDVSKEAAGMTLLDDNFATIVAAVEEGRIVFGNIKKYLMYLLSCNVGEIVLLAGAVIAGFPMPLTAVQILYVNLATDGLPALALAVDPPEPDLMGRKPRDPRVGIFTRPVVMLLLTAGVWSALVNVTLFTWLLRSGRPLEQVMAMTFVSLVLIQFFNAYNCRSDRLSIVRRPFANRWLNLADRVGGAAAGRDRVRPVFSAGVRHVQLLAGRLDADDRAGLLDCAGGGSRKVDGTARLVRGAGVICRRRGVHAARRRADSTGAAHVQQLTSAPTEGALDCRSHLRAG